MAFDLASQVQTRCAEKLTTHQPHRSACHWREFRTGGTGRPSIENRHLPHGKQFHSSNRRRIETFTPLSTMRCGARGPWLLPRADGFAVLTIAGGSIGVVMPTWAGVSTAWRPAGSRRGAFRAGFASVENLALGLHRWQRGDAALSRMARPTISVTRRCRIRCGFTICTPRCCRPPV